MIIPALAIAFERWPVGSDYRFNPNQNQDMKMERENAIPYVTRHVDDALSTDEKPITDRTRLVGWQHDGLTVVAVHSYLPDSECNDEEAAELAMDWLNEIGFFSGGPEKPDFVI